MGFGHRRDRGELRQVEGEGEVAVHGIARPEHAPVVVDHGTSHATSQASEPLSTAQSVANVDIRVGRTACAIALPT